MSNRSKAASSDTPRRRRRLGRIAPALAVLLMTWTAASSDVRAERILLKSGEVIEGAIIDATRNTVIIRRSIGGMRQMRIQDIEEVRFDLAQGQEMAGEFLSWADGVYRIRSGEQTIRISEGGVVSREPREQAARQVARRSPAQPVGQQQNTAAAATPTPAAEPESEGQNQGEAAGSAAAEGMSNAAARAASSATADTETDTAADAEGQAAADAQSSAAGDAESEAGDVENAAVGEAERQALAKAESQAAVTGNERAAAGDQGSPAVKASVDPPEPGARSMVFKIELSQPAAQTVVLIYGTVDGTAKAGEDYEAQHGMVTLTPGAKSAEVHVPLIGGQPENGDKRFELVLMADPKVADVVDRRVTATIKGAD